MIALSEPLELQYLPIVDAIDLTTLYVFNNDNMTLFNFSQHFILIILFVTGIVAGTVDAIAGGGGLISLPMLLSAGVPPHIALGTNKLQTTTGTFVATFNYYRQGWFSLKTVYKGLIFGFLGAVLGAVLSQYINGDLLRKIIPILLFIILMYTIFSPHLGIEEKKPKLREFWFYVIFGFIMGFYDGFFGPGTGSFWVFLLTFFLGYNFTKASAYAKVFNLKSNVIATFCFILGRNIDYHTALCMAAGQIIGGRLGSYLAIKNGAQLIRPIFISVVSFTIISLIYKNHIHSELILSFVQYVGFLNMILLSIIFLFSLIIFYSWNRKLKCRSVISKNL